MALKAVKHWQAEHASDDGVERLLGSQDAEDGLGEL
jgi:hypothetical protein